MFLKIVQSLLLVGLLTGTPAASARTLAAGAGEATPVKGNGLINQIIVGKNTMTINGMDFVYTPGRTKVSGTTGPKAGQQVEYTAVPEGKTHRITEIRVLPAVDEPSKTQ